MKQFLLYLLVPVLVGLTSCSDSEDIERIPTGDVAHKAWLSVPSNSSDLTSTDIDNIVANLRETTSKSRTNDYSVLPITDKNDEAIAYVLNFGTDDGFIVLSANKKNFPLIASSESGHIDLDSIKDTPAWDWIYEMASIEPSAEMPDSISFKIARAWDEITKSLKTYASLSGRSTGDPYVDSVTESAIAAWREQGYEVVAVKDANVESLPINVRNAVQDMYNRNNNYEIETSFILIKEEPNYVRTNPMITAQWHEGHPYNAAIPMERPIYTPVVTVAKIMHFHDFPKAYNLSTMPLSLTTATANDPLPQFMLILGRLCGYNYNTDNISGMTAMCDALARTGYNYTQAKYNSSKIVSSLKNSRPVIMSYDKKSGNTIRTYQWICDGYRGGNLNEIYYLVAYTGDFADIDPTMAFSLITSDNICYSPTSSWHMNFTDNRITGNYYGNKWKIDFASGEFTISGSEVTTLIDIYPK